MDEILEQIYEILEEIIPGEDYRESDSLVDDNILDSFAILSLVSELEDAFDIIVSPAELISEHFNSAAALAEMVDRLQAGE